MSLDYNLSACLDYNPQAGIHEDNITDVLAVWEGENDGDNWRWVVSLDNGKYAFIEGGCDYTGWDCQSWASSTIVDTPEEAANQTDNDQVLIDLETQIYGTKKKTWRETKDEEFGVTSVLK